MTDDAAKNLLTAGFVVFFLGESPDFLKWRTAAVSGSPSWMALQVSNEPKGSAEVGLVRTERMSGDVAAMMAGLLSEVTMPASDWSVGVAAMSSTLRGRSAMNLSMAQSWTVQVTGFYCRCR